MERVLDVEINVVVLTNKQNYRIRFNDPAAAQQFFAEVQRKGLLEAAQSWCEC